MPAWAIFFLHRPYDFRSLGLYGGIAHDLFMPAPSPPHGAQDSATLWRAVRSARQTRRRRKRVAHAFELNARATAFAARASAETVRGGAAAWRGSGAQRVQRKRSSKRVQYSTAFKMLPLPRGCWSSSRAHGGAAARWRVVHARMRQQAL